MKNIVRISSVLIFGLIPISIIIWLLSNGIANVDCENVQTGYNLLVPLIAKWGYYRNLAYVFYVLLFFLIGMGKIFKGVLTFIISLLGSNFSTVKFNITEVIPGIVLSMLLTTFSYAIAGLCLDVWNIARCLFQ